MKYEYCGISLGDDVKDIINKFDISKIEYRDSMKRLYFKLGNFSKKTNLECFLSIPIETGKVIYIIIFDENFKLFNELEIWQELTNEIKEKYELYYDEDDDGIYLSKKYKYLKIGVDEGYGRIEGFKDYKERIFSFIFDAQEDIRWILQQDKITNYLECQNLQDIYNSLYDNKTLDVDIEKREIYGQLDNYKFIFSLLTRDIKSIQNLETREFIKTSLEQIEIKISLKFLILKAIWIENIYIAFSIVDPRLDITVVFEGTSEDLGYKVKVIFTDPSNSPQLIGVDKKGNTYIKNGTAYVDKNTGIGYILVNTESPANSTKAGVIGTIAEEQSHVIGKKEGRQKVVPDGSEKGLESLGKPTNDYFKKEYSKNDKAIDLKSDGKDYSNVDFGENVGDKKNDGYNQYKYDLRYTYQEKINGNIYTSRKNISKTYTEKELQETIDKNYGKGYYKNDWNRYSKDYEYREQTNYYFYQAKHFVKAKTIDKIGKDYIEITRDNGEKLKLNKIEANQAIYHNIEKKNGTIYFNFSGETRYKKYVNEDGYELILDQNNKPVYDPVVVGTYNFHTYDGVKNPIDLVSHTKDMELWKKYGTGPNDPTTREEIGDLKIQKYYREIEKELNIRKKDSVSSNELKEIVNKIEETAENKRKNEIYKMIN